MNCDYCGIELEKSESTMTDMGDQICSPCLIGKIPEDGNKLETIKANILKAISEEHANLDQFISSLVKGINLDDSIETKLAKTLHSGLTHWADARVYMHRALRVLINTAQDHQKNIENNYSVDAGWVTAKEYEDYIVKSKKREHEIWTVCYFIGLESKDSASLFEKVSSLIEYK
jgi:hypothetical protein